MSTECDFKLRLHYFDCRARGELIRYILKFAGQEFEDCRIKFDEWPQKKSQYPNGQVPVLEIIKDGKSHFLTQSNAIARTLARKNKLTGCDEREAAHCDEVVDCITDLFNLSARAFFEADPQRKEQLKTRMKTEDGPRTFGFLEKKLKENGGKHMVGSCFTWADLSVAVFLYSLRKQADDGGKAFGEKFPGLCALVKSVEETPAIAAWLKERPESQFPL